MPGAWGGHLARWLRVYAVLAGAVSLLAVDSARADDGVPGDAGAPASTLPSFMSGKRKLDPYDLSRKVEGDYFTPIPEIDSDPDTGFGLGGRVYYFVDGNKTDPLYEYTPYRHSLYVDVFDTTGGYQSETVSYDAPYLGDSAYRLRAQLGYEKNIAANYFGRGASTLNPLGFPGSSTKFTSFDAYTTALQGVYPPAAATGRGDSFFLYNKYSYEDPALRTSVERDFFGGIVRALVGFSGSHARVVDYSYETVTAVNPKNQSVPATEAPTRLHDDCAIPNLLVGCGGGWNNMLKLGVAFDTRDYEPDPNSGVFIDATAEISNRAFGSSFDYVRFTVSPRVFYSPFPRWTDLVLAGRVVYSMQTSGTPFFAMNTLAFTDGDRQGLGGVWTLRGYNQDRFVGPIAAMTNVEIRWTFLNLPEFLSQNFSLALVPFLDMGRVFDTVQTLTFAGWKRGEGGSLRILWNKASIIRADVGFSDEGWDLYLDFGHQF
jgi:outer membrane protein assembly factor BamA